MVCSCHLFWVWFEKLRLASARNPNVAAFVVIVNDDRKKRKQLVRVGLLFNLNFNKTEFP